MGVNFIMSLNYHDVIHDDNSESGFQNLGAIQYKLKSSEFERQICAITDYFESKQLDKTQIALTFDDGGESSYSVIAPILEKYGFKGYFFITTSLIGTPGFMKSWQILDMYKRKHFIGVHSHTHPKNISKLPYAKVEEEWSLCVEILSSILSDNIKIASIPGGFYSGLSGTALKKSGIEMIFTSKPSKKIELNTDNQYIIGRFSIKNGTSCQTVIRLLNNNSFIQIYEFIKWWGLTRVRSALGKNYYRIREILLKIS